MTCILDATYGGVRAVCYQELFPENYLVFGTISGRDGYRQFLFFSSLTIEVRVEESQL